MSDQPITNGAANPEAKGPQFGVEKIYVRDVSFEAPNSPQMFSEQGPGPQLQMNLNHRAQRINDEVFEVVLAVTLTCTVNEKTAYLAEVQQAGLFSLRGFEDAAAEAVLATHCPNILYPYVRQTVGDLIQAGGFPPFLLQPISFEALYAENLRKRAQQQQVAGGSGDLAGSEPAGNA